MTTIYALADIHGQLPDWRDCPECDLLLIGGDICPDMLPEDQFRWLNQVFRTWLERVPARNIVGIAGNHDLTF
jgi:DNA repair exonuclease SbcCD nuclease subunit